MKDMFEFSVAEYDPKALDPFGGFLQVSGTFISLKNFIFFPHFNYYYYFEKVSTFSTI